MLRPTHDLSRVRIAAAADRLLRRSLDIGVWDGRAPIPVELIAECVEELRLDWVPLVGGQAGATLVGALNAADRIIHLNELQRVLFQEVPGLDRFTIGHELGHFELHVTRDEGQLAASRTTPDLICGANTNTVQEREADTFSAALLMPENLIRQCAHGRNTGLWPRVYSLRDLFGVSAAAMRNRLRDLGYPTPPEGVESAAR